MFIRENRVYIVESWTDFGVFKGKFICLLHLNGFGTKIDSFTVSGERTITVRSTFIPILKLYMFSTERWM